MAKPKETVAAATDLLNETFPGAEAANTAEVADAAPVAELPIPEGWSCVDLTAIGLPNEYRTSADPSLRFNTLSEVYAHINKASIADYVDKFMDHAKAHPETYFSTGPRKERKTKKDKTDKKGNVIPAGTVIPGRSARPMTGVALRAAETRLREAASLFVAWQYADQAAG